MVNYSLIITVTPTYLEQCISLLDFCTGAVSLCGLSLIQLCFVKMLRKSRETNHHYDYFIYFGFYVNGCTFK